MLKLSDIEIEIMGEAFTLEVEWDDLGGGIHVETAVILKRGDYNESGVFCTHGHWTRVDIFPLLTDAMESQIVDAITEEREFLKAA